MKFSSFILLVVVSVFWGKYEAIAQFRHSISGNALPWTVVPEIDGDSYRFVILGDVTSGEIDGLLDKAVVSINTLAPDFVISVGDQIDGYTTDVNAIGEQWTKFNRSISKLEMPFLVMR